MDKRVFIYSIIASLVASLAFYAFLEPTFNWLWNYASHSARASLVALQNEAFVSASLGKRDWVGPLMFLLIAGTFSSICIGSLSATWTLWLFGGKIGKIISALGNTTTEEKKEAGNLSEKRSKKADSKESTRRDRMKIWRRRLLFGLTLFLTLWVLDTMYFLTRTSFVVYVDLQLNTSFSQRLDALGPYIDFAEEKRLRSAWALMRSRRDYEQINARMEGLAHKAKLVLPAPLYK